MANVTISDLDPLSPPMTGTEVMEIEREGVSYQVTAGDVAQAPPAATAITSGADPVELDPLVLMYAVTTGGTGGIEILNLPNPTVDVNEVNLSFIGRRMVIYLATQTDPGDIVRITVDGSTEAQLFNSTTIDGIGSYTAIGMSFEGSAAAFIWTSYEWVLHTEAVGFNHDYTPHDTRLVSVNGGDATATGSAQPTTIRGGLGNADHTAGGAVNVTGGLSLGTDKGGIVTLRGGNSKDGESGDVVIRAGDPNVNGGSTGTRGNVKIIGLPTSDPGVLGALWNNAGNLKISAG